VVVEGALGLVEVEPGAEVFECGDGDGAEQDAGEVGEDVEGDDGGGADGGGMGRRKCGADRI
jgi:hypothetical protein